MAGPPEGGIKWDKTNNDTRRAKRRQKTHPMVQCLLLGLHTSVET